MATYLRKLKREDMRNKCPNIRVLQGPIYASAKMRYTRAKMRVYAGLVNHVVYSSTRRAFLLHGSSCMVTIKITLTRSRQYGGSSKMPCPLDLSVI